MGSDRVINLVLIKSWIKIFKLIQDFLLFILLQD